MSVGVRIVCRPVLAPGFGLTSLRVSEAASAADADVTVRGLVGDPAVGILLVEDHVHDRLPDELRRRLARRPTPILVPFPGPAWEERRDAAESYIIELLRQIIGYRVRLR
ncbi:MAG TPA: V-type ATP synthase subunit F [Gemmatimonadales bacterium]|nr:V-type ATP synthase subunit F [Gemmatimonadales bacterium]